MNDRSCPFCRGESVTEERESRCLTITALSPKSDPEVLVREDMTRVRSFCGECGEQLFDKTILRPPL